ISVTVPESSFSNERGKRCTAANFASSGKEVTLNQISPVISGATFPTSDFVKKLNICISSPFSRGGWVGCVSLLSLSPPPPPPPQKGGKTTQPFFSPKKNQQQSATTAARPSNSAS